jgi:hypothetical protein
MRRAALGGLASEKSRLRPTAANLPEPGERDNVPRGTVRTCDPEKCHVALKTL